MENNIKKKWTTYPAITDEISANLDGYPKIFQQILFNRGIEDKVQAEDFIKAEKPLYDPHQLKGIETAAALVHQTILNQERILIFGDYDVDGVTSTVLLVQLLRKYQADVRMYIPNRFKQGYGFSFDALDEVLKMQPDLIITVDCGVRSIEEVKFASSRGVKTIITDHHQPFKKLPPAAAIVCPRQPQDQYPNKSLAGVGIAYKLAEYFMSVHPLKDEHCGQWLDLVALGTVADLAPISGENRVLIHKGIELMRNDPRPGIRALANVSKVNIEELDAQHIGFMLGPRLNAAGRLSSADRAFDLLMAPDMETAGKLALDLDEENQARRLITREIQQNVEENYDFSLDQWLILFANKEFNEGVIGLAASRLVDSFYRPSIIGVEKDDVVRASCRSIPELNITSALDECMDLLVQHGGHAMAAGLTVKKENLTVLKARLSEIVERELADLELCPVINAEMELTLSSLHPSIIKYLDYLEPTGMKNPKPLFISHDVEIRQLRAVGQHKDHLKLVVADSEENRSKNQHTPVVVDAIAFRFGYLLEECQPGSLVDILYTYETNTFNGRRNIQLNIRDIHVK